MAKRVLLFTCLVFLVFSAFQVQPARAVFQPYQAVYAEVRGNTIYFDAGVSDSQSSWTLPGKYDARFEFYKFQEGIVAWVVSYLAHTWSSDRTWEVHYCVYDPARGGWQEGHKTFGEEDGAQRKVWEANESQDWFQIKDGVLAFLYENVYGGSVRAHHLILLTYSPVARWEEERRTYLFQAPNLGAQWLTVKDGVVLWAVGGRADNTSFLSFLGVFYDMAKFVLDLVDGNWMGALSEAYGVYQGLENIDTGDSRRTVYFSIYDPAAPLPGWVTEKYFRDDGVAYSFQGIQIFNATAYIYTYYIDSQNEVIPTRAVRGYSHAQGRWVEGPTEPLAWFVAQPCSGSAPLGVQFWDMSIGAAAWSRDWLFSDASYTAANSPVKTYANMGDGWARLAVNQYLGGFRFQAIKVTDGSAPTGGILINGGASVTNSRNAVLTLSAVDNVGVEKMSFGFRLGSFPIVWGDWEPYQTTRYYTLIGSPSTVYVRYRDAAENVSPTYSASITVDTTPPTGTMTINGGDAVTEFRNVGLGLFTPDSDVTEMMVWDDGTILLSGPVTYWVPYSSTLPWTISLSENGVRTVYARFKDAAGNVSDLISATIELNTTNPPGSHFAMSINGFPGNFSVYSSHYLEQVNLQISANVRGYTIMQMQLGNGTQDRFGNWTINWGAWEPYSTTKPWNFLGQYTGVFARFQDNYGTIYGPISAGYLLDITPPTDGTLAGIPLQTKISLHWSGFADNRSGLKTYELYYSPSGFPDRSTGILIYQGLATQFIQSGLTPGKPCYYRLYAIDNAGNVSTGATLQSKTLPSRKPLAFLSLLLSD